MGQIFTVSNAAELSAAIGSASGGDRIELQSGEYGELYLKYKSFDGEGVTIASANPDDMAVFDKIFLNNIQNLHFDRIEIDYEPVGDTGYFVAFRAAGGENISITNSLLHGGTDPDRDPQYADSPMGIGVQLLKVDNVVIQGNEIHDFHAGVSVAYVNGLTVNDNYIHEVRTLPLGGGAVNDVEIIGNHLSGVYPVNFGKGGDHADMIHFYPLSGQEGAMDNIVIRDNFLEQGDSPQPVLGILIDDSGGGVSGLGYTNMIIDNNVIHNGNAQGIQVENVNGLQITNNSLLQSSGSGLGSAPGVLLSGGTQNVVLDNNIISGYIAGSAVNGTNVNIGDNLFVQDRDPFGENYVGDLFVNGLTPNGDVEDMMPLEGSAAEGYGADLSRFDLPEGAHIAVISDTRGEGLDMKSIHFDAKSLFDTDGEIDFSNAELSWDFGDGTTGTGDAINHTYGSAGSYDVTATFTFSDGKMITVDKTIDVFTPQAVMMDFEGSISDTSDIANRVTTKGGVRLEEGRFGDALRLVNGTSQVSIGRSEEIIDNPDFSISFAFQKDGGTETNSDDGMFVYYTGTSYISTGNGSLAFTGTTSTGRVIRMNADVDQIEDGGWHHLTYTFSSTDRSAILYLDGEEVDRVDGVSGIQRNINGHDMLLGGRTGGAFGGLMDEVEFTRAALTPEEVQERYESLFGIEGEAEKAPFVEIGDAYTSSSPNDLNGRPEAGSLLSFDGQQLAVSSFAEQDKGNAVITSDGSGITLTNNAWKQLLTDVTIASDTRLSFTFQSDVEGEIHGIGFETDGKLDPRAIFQLDGTQRYGIQAFNDQYTTGTGPKAYDIDVGRFITGEFDRMVLIMDNDLGAGGNSVFTNIDLTTISSGPLLNFNGQQLGVGSFVGQDKGSAVVLSDGSGVTLTNNAWKQLLTDVVITEESRLQFNFSSNKEGEIHGIGFETDGQITESLVFQLSGTQTYGIQDFDDYVTGEGVRSYDIPVGEYLSGTFDRMVLIMDEDVGFGGDSTFSDLIFV